MEHKISTNRYNHHIDRFRYSNEHLCHVERWGRGAARQDSEVILLPSCLTCLRKPLQIRGYAKRKPLVWGENLSRSRRQQQLLSLDDDIPRRSLCLIWASGPVPVECTDWAKVTRSSAGRVSIERCLRRTVRGQCQWIRLIPDAFYSG